jgi:hypothetical protein
MAPAARDEERRGYEAGLASSRVVPGASERWMDGFLAGVRERHYEELLAEAQGPAGPR